MPYLLNIAGSWSVWGDDENSNSGIESQNSAVLSPGSGIVSQKWDVPYLPKWWSMRRRNRIFVFTQQAFYAS